MLSSTTAVKSLLQKKKQSTTTTTVSTSAQLPMNRTSLSTISTASQNNNKEKLSQLKEKLEKQRQSMRSTGRRFREGGKSEVEIQTDNEVQNQNKKEISSKGLKVSKGTATAGLFDFGTIKSQVENKLRGGFVKKGQQVKKTDGIIPIYTTKQILQMSQSPVSQQNIKSNRLLQVDEKKQLKRETVSLMELSQVFAVDLVELNNDKDKRKQQRHTESEFKFVNVQKTSKDNIQSSLIYMNNSQVFSAAINEQKKRNNQVKEFLSQVNLERFADELISLGFDEVQTLLEVNLEELNAVRMRSKQQDALIKYIKEYRLRNNMEDNTLQQKPLPIIGDKMKSINRLRTAPTTSSPISTQSHSQTTTQASRLRSVTNNLSQIPNNFSQSTLSNKSSIFYFMGGNQWSLQSQIRKACSGCFKVSYQAIKRKECYYCEECDPGEEDFQIQLHQSMVRDYR